MKFSFQFNSDNGFMHVYFTVSLDQICAFNEPQEQIFKAIQMSAIIELKDGLSDWNDIDESNLHIVDKKDIEFIKEVENFATIPEKILRAPIGYQKRIQEEADTVLKKLNAEELKLTSGELYRLLRYQLFSLSELHPIKSYCDTSQACRFNVVEYENRVFVLAEPLSDAILPRNFLPLSQGYRVFKNCGIFDAIKIDRIKELIVFHPYLQELRQHFTAMILHMTKDSEDRVTVKLKLFDPKEQKSFIAQAFNIWQRISSINFYLIRQIVDADSFEFNTVYGSQAWDEHTECGHRVRLYFENMLHHFIDDASDPSSPISIITKVDMHLNKALARSNIAFPEYKETKDSIWKNELTQQLQDEWIEVEHEGLESGP